MKISIKQKRFYIEFLKIEYLRNYKNEVLKKFFIKQNNYIEFIKKSKQKTILEINYIN